MGTLPTRGKDDDLDLAGLATLPSFYVEGPIDQVYGSFVSMQGVGAIDVEAIPQPHGNLTGERHIRMTFRGEVRITFDSMMFGGDELKTGISTHAALGSTVALALTQTHILLREEVPPMVGLEIPFGSFQRLGLLTSGVHVLTSNRIRGRDIINVSSVGGLIEINQSQLGN